LRNQSVEYLAAVLSVDKLPSEEFYVIRGPDDLNPTIVRQWDSYLHQASRGFNAVFALWHEFEKLPAKDFGARAAETIQAFSGHADSTPVSTAHILNSLVLRTFATNPPGSMRDVAKQYGELLVSAHKSWLDLIKKANEDKGPAPASLPDKDQEELRQVLYAPDAPVLVPSGAIVDLEWFFDEGGRVELAKLQAEIDRWIIKSTSPPYAVILEDRPTQRNPRVFIRGNPANKGEEVPRRFLEVLAGENRKPFMHGSGRLDLADAIASKSNPLTARVMVNRVWLHHFGAGLVKTLSDFGTRSEPPSHPELLDWLACRFMDEGWSIKKLHRLIMLSAVYQQSSDAGETLGAPSAKHLAARPAASRIDPENRLLWHFTSQRLDFESMRDSLLAVSGELDQDEGGKPVELFKRPFPLRRTIYGFIDRQFLPGVFRVFDFANPDMHSPQRLDTTVPQQALFFMNSPFVVERARSLASRPEVGSLENPKRRVQELYRLIFQRQPTAGQVQLAEQFIEAAQAMPPSEPPKAAVSPWQYGYGEYDEQSQRVGTFKSLSRFVDEAWQGGPSWPDEKLGWVRLTAEGGHAGNDREHAAIRRWVAPRDALVVISGILAHEHKDGDGVRGFIVSSRLGQLGSWSVHNDKAETRVGSLEVKQGDSIDFIVDCNANFANDHFKWAPVIKPKETTAAGDSPEYAREWSAAKDFAGPPEPPPKPLSPWEKYAQVLLLSNEFMFVD
jgi:hypothetical protein